PGSILGGPLASVKTGGALTLNAVGDIAQSVDPTVTPLTIAAAELASVRAGGQVDLIDRAGDLVIDTGAVLAAGGPAQLSAPGGSIVQDLVGCDPAAGACVAVTGEGLELQAPTGQIGSATTFVGLALTGAGALTATAPKGIYLETSGSATVDALTATSGPVTLVVTAGNTSGDLNLEKITAGGLVSLFVDGGVYALPDALQSDDSGCETVPTAADVTACAKSTIDAPQAVIKAGTQIGTSATPLPIHVAELEVNSFGDMWIQNFGDLRVDPIVPAFTGLTAKGTLHLSVGSDLTVNAPISAAAQQLLADGSVTIAAAVNITGLAEVVAGSYIAFERGGYIDAGGQAVLCAGCSDSGTFPADTIDAAASPPGSILNLDATGGVNVTADQLTLTADGGSIGGVGGSPIVGGAVLIDQTGSSGLTASAGTGIYVEQSGGPLRVATATTTGGDLQLTVLSTGAVDQDLVLDTGATVKAPFGSVTLTAAGNLTLQSGSSAAAGESLIGSAVLAVQVTGATVTAGTADVAGNGSLSLTARDLMTLTGSTLTGSDGVALTASGGDLGSFGSSVASGAGSVSLSATAGDLTVATGSIVTGEQNATLDAFAALTVSGSSVTATTGRAWLTAGGALLVSSDKTAASMVAAGTGLIASGATVTVTASALNAGQALTATSAGDLTADAASSLTAGTVMTVDGGQAGAASAIVLDGGLVAQLIEVHAGDGGDAVTFAPVSLVGYAQLWA
ncbi:MAG: beta strand repeat-containing protein, partial [Solirubrobacteraceae bacterium]